MLFWVSAIVQDEGKKKPWLLAVNTGELTLTSAEKHVDFIKNNHNVLSIWVDKIDEDNNKETIFHECFIDAFGNLK